MNMSLVSHTAVTHALAQRLQAHRIGFIGTGLPSQRNYSDMVLQRTPTEPEEQSRTREGQSRSLRTNLNIDSCSVVARPKHVGVLAHSFWFFQPPSNGMRIRKRGRMSTCIFWHVDMRFLACSKKNTCQHLGNFSIHVRHFNMLVHIFTC